MNAIVEEIREAYATVGIALDQPVAFGTYYRSPIGLTRRRHGPRIAPRF